MTLGKALSLVVTVLFFAGAMLRLGMSDPEQNASIADVWVATVAALVVAILLWGAWA